MIPYHQIIIGEDARIDVQEAVEWYELQKPELGMDFFMKFEESIEVLHQTPEQYAKVFDDFRRLLIHKYPYAVYYVINKELLTIEIVAVFHTSRNLENLKNRIKP